MPNPANPKIKADRTFLQLRIRPPTEPPLSKHKRAKTQESKTFLSGSHVKYCDKKLKETVWASHDPTLLQTPEAGEVAVQVAETGAPTDAGRGTGIDFEEPGDR